MYYEIFEEIKYSQDTLLPVSNLQLVNKSVLDSCFDPRSKILKDYPKEENFRRLQDKSYPYLAYQRILVGIAKTIFLGFNPWQLPTNIFLPDARIRVPDQPLEFNMSSPRIYFKMNESLSFETSSFGYWNTELLAIAEELKPVLGLTITETGFRSHLFRILENIYSFRSSNSKRTPWVQFFHDLLILDKKYSSLEVEALFQQTQESQYCIVENKSFPTLDYLEFNFSKKIGTLNTKVLAESIKRTKEDSFSIYSDFNKGILGKIPLCHFYIGEHMFLGKEEYNLNQYYDYYVKPWTSDKAITIHYLDLSVSQVCSASLQDFPLVLKQAKYVIILGAESADKGYIDSTPRMIKD